MLKKIVNINELRKVAVEHRPDVNVWEVQKQARDLYTAIKLVGIENVTAVYHVQDDITQVEKTGKDISKRSRALSAYLMMNMLQMSDSTTSRNRLETHYGEISMEAAFGHMFGGKHVSKSTLSDRCVLEKYLDNGYQLENHTNEIWVGSLYSLIVEKNPNVDLWTLWIECDKLYKSIVTVGLENTIVYFYNNASQKVTFKGKEIPERIRAFSLFCVVHMYRFRDDDTNMHYLQERYMLSAGVKAILGDTDIFKDSLDNLECITLRDIAGRYLRVEKAGKMNNSPILLQQPYNAIEMKKFNSEDYESIYELWTALDSLYKMVKIIGVDDVKVRFKDANKKDVEMTGREIPARIRAFCEESIIYMYRMNDSNASRSRMEQHLGLEYPSKYILGDTNVVCCGSKSLPCMSLRELVQKL